MASVFLREPDYAIIGESSVMQRVLTDLRTAAITDAPILLVGENGTGKKLLARYIHKESPRRNGPFASVHCGGIPKDLLHSELFGHERGAFTGAHAQRRGKIELAQGGTLFLDAISELPTSLQTALASYLAEGIIQRLGGNEQIAVSSRILAASHEQPGLKPREGELKRELFYRFVLIEVPPLRERKDDIPALISFFLNKFSEKYRKPVSGVTQEARELLLKYDYPGNVRELETLVEKAVVLTQNAYISSEHFPIAVATGTLTPDMGMKKVVMTTERAMILEALVRAGWVQTRAASALGISERMLRYKMKKLGIHKETAR